VQELSRDNFRHWTPSAPSLRASRQPIPPDLVDDLPENTVRYCFRTLADAATSKWQFGNASERRAAAAGE